MRGFVILSAALAVGTVAAVSDPKLDADHPAGITWRIGRGEWQDDAAFENFKAFVLEQRLTGKISFFIGSHVPPPLEKMRSDIRLLSKRMAAFQALGYETGVNIVSTLGHVDESLETCVQLPGARKFTNVRGEVARGNFCPTDPVWREQYLKPLYEMLAKSGADFVWSDDDIRLENHGVQGWGCCCDGCMEKIRAALGFRGTRTEFAAWLDDPQEGDARRRRYLQFRRDTVAELTAYLARVVRQANPKAVFGIMDATFYDQVSYPEKYAAVEGGRLPLYWRPGGGFYRDNNPDDLLNKINGLAFECAWIPGGVTRLEAEIEDFDYQRLNKSVHFNVLEALSYCAVATRGVAYNVFCSADACGDIRCNAALVSALERVRPTLDAYVEAADNACSVGVYSGKGRDSCLAKDVRPGVSWLDAPVAEDVAPFLGSELQRIGLPAAYRPAEAQVFAVNGKAVRAMSDAEIVQMLSKGAYLSSDAAEELVRRGYGEDIGFGVKGPAEGETDVERFAAHPLNAGFEKLTHYAGPGFWGGVAYDLEPKAGAQTVMHCGPRHPCVAGAFENKRGGRVYVNGYFPWDRLSNEVKSEQMKRIFRWLSREGLSGYVASYHRMALWVRGNRTAVVLNMSADAARGVDLMLNAACSGGVAEIVDGEAARRVRLTGVREGAYWRYRLPEVAPWSICVLRLKVPEDGPLFYNIAPFSPGQEKTVAADMIEYAERTGFRKVLYSLTLHPEGRPARTKVEGCLASYRKLKDELRGSPVELGILLQSILGHWPRTDRDIEPWQRTIDANGEAKRFCPLDPGFRAYIRETARLVAAERPAFILGDDDIRAFSPQAECFCPLHVAEFNRRRGTSYDGARMREAVRSSKPGQPDYEVFMALQREYVNGVCALLREGIDSVDPSIPAGSCMPFWEFRFNDRASHAIAAAGQRTLMRFGNGNYHEWYAGPLALVGVTQKTQSYFAYHHDRVDDILAEADTYPHHLWSRSAVGWQAHLAMNLFVGLRGAKLWFVNAHKGPYAVPRSYTETLARNAGLYRTLCREMRQARPLGLMEPCSTNFPTWHPVNRIHEFFVSDRTWATEVLGRHGVPYASGRDFGAAPFWTLAGAETVSRLSDHDLTNLLSRSVLVDGDAAVALTKRGFAGLTGVAAAADGELMFNCEVASPDDFGYGLTKSDEVPRLTPTAAVDVVTHLAYRSLPDSPAEFVAPGVTRYENALGGRVVVSAFHLRVSGDRICGPQRQAWLRKVLDALDPERTLPMVVNEQDVSLLASETADKSLMLAVFNLNRDTLPFVDLQVGTPPRSVEWLQGDGRWKELACDRVDGRIRLPVTLPCTGVAVLRLR